MKGFCIKPKYADDLTLIGTSKVQIDEIEAKIPVQLRKCNLEVNTSKTERHEIPRPDMSLPPPAAETPKKLKKTPYAGQNLIELPPFATKSRK